MTQAGDLRDEYIAKAKKYVQGKNETSILNHRSPGHALVITLQA